MIFENAEDRKLDYIPFAMFSWFYNISESILLCISKTYVYDIIS